MSPNPIRLPVFETIKTSWARVKGAKCTFWGVFGCLLAIQFVLVGFDMLTDNSKGQAIVNGGLALACIMVLYFILTILKILLQWGIVYIAVQRAMDFPIQFNMIKNVFSFGVFFRMIGLVILQFIVLIPAAIFIFLPILFKVDPTTITTNTSDILKLLTASCYIIGGILAVFLSVRMSLAVALVITKKTNPWKAIKISFKATKSNVWRLIGLHLMNVIIILVSIIPIGIGLIWTIPYAMITYGVIYKKLVLDRQDLNNQL